MQILVFDWGGTQIKYKVFKIQNKQTLCFGSVFTPNNQKDFLKIIEKIFVRFHKKYFIDNVVICHPGNYNSKKDIIEYESALPFIHTKKFMKKLKEIIDLPMFFINDANAGAYSVMNNLKIKTDFVYLALGTGIGGAIVLNNKLYLGSNNKAGELGMINAFENQKFQKLNSITKVMKEFNKLTNLNCVDGAVFLTKYYEQNDILATWLVNEFVSIISQIIFNVIAVLDVHLIVLGGGISNYKPLKTLIKNELKKLNQQFNKMPMTAKIKLAKKTSYTNVEGGYYYFLKQKNL